MMTDSVMGAVVVKKAASVNTQEVNTIDAATGLAPILGVVSTLSELKAQRKALKQECIPTSSEISWVNNMIKEWAKTGAKSATEACNSLHSVQCSENNSYQRSVRDNPKESPDSYCFEVFNENGAIWNGYPRASIGTRCDDGSTSCKNQETYSNIYEIFELIDFSKEDYLKDEISMAEKLIEKREKCSGTRLTDKQRELYQGFISNTIGDIGKKQNAGTVLDTVQNLLNNSSGGLGAASALAPTLMQILDK